MTYNNGGPVFGVTADSFDWYRAIAFLVGFVIAWLLFRKR